MSRPIYVIHYDVIDSTNAQAKRLANEWNSELVTLLIAKRQTAGYGRFGRQWVSSSTGNLYCSYIYIVSPQQPCLNHSAQVSALALSLAIESFSGISSKLKWPNDLSVDGQKLAGILVETTLRSDGQLCLIIGIGLNLNVDPSELMHVGQPATSLSALTGAQWAISQVVHEVSTYLHSHLKELFKGGFSSFHSAYLDRLVHVKGDWMSVKTPFKSYEGFFFDVDEKGTLWLIGEDGTPIHCDR